MIHEINLNLPSYFLYICFALSISICAILGSRKYISLYVNEGCIKNNFLIVFFSFFLSAILTFFAVNRKIDNTGLGGADAYYYANVFQHIIDYFDWSNPFLSLDGNEPLYYILAWTINKITINYKYFFLLVYFLIIFTYVYILLKNISSGNMSVVPAFYLVIPYLNGYNVLRFSLGVALALWGIESYQNKRYFKSALYFLIAVSCHFVTVVIPVCLLFASIFLKNKNSKKPIRIFVIWCLALIISQVALGCISIVLIHLGYRNYLGKEVSFFAILPTTICCLMAFIFYRDVSERLDNNRVYLNLLWCNFIFIPVFSIASFGRINDMFCIPRLIVWSAIIDSIRKRLSSGNRVTKNAITLCIIFLCAIWTIFRIYRMSRSKVIPYILYL